MADNGTQTTTTWPIPGGPAGLHPGTLHIRVHNDSSVESELTAAAQPLVNNGAYLVHAANLIGITDVLRDLGRYDRKTAFGDIEREYTFVYADSLLTLTAALYRAWATQPGRAIVYVVHDWINVLTRLNDRDDHLAATWLRAALAADHEALYELSGLSYAYYTRQETPVTPYHPKGGPEMTFPRPTFLISTSLRKAGLNRPGGPQLEDVKGGPLLLDTAETVVRAETVHTGHQIRTGRLTPLKAPDGTGGPIEIQRPLHALGGWRPAS